MDKGRTSQKDKAKVKGRFEMKEIMCKTCMYYHPQVGTAEDLSGQLEAETKPYGRCQIMEDPVREDEWCGQWAENAWMKWLRKNETFGRHNQD